MSNCDAPVKIPDLKTLGHFFDGAWHPQDTAKIHSVYSPYNGTEIARLRIADAKIVAQAVVAAHKASQEWGRVPIKERCAKVLKFRTVLLEYRDELAHIIAAEAGKTLGEAGAEIDKGIEVCEFAASIQNSEHETIMDVSRGVSCQYRREALGVVAGIVPFNFPAMVPMWMFPIAITAGNAFIMKASEKVPLTLSRIAELMLEAGYPPGVFNVLHGDSSTANAIIDHELVKAVAFVGSTPVAKLVYQRTSLLGKRCLALGGAKNHIILVPDADPEFSIKGIVDSFTGCAGQRCMAASVLLVVGDCEHLLAKICLQAANIRPGRGIGAIIDSGARARITSIIDRAEAQGAKIRVDGRQIAPPQGMEQGQWLGATIIDQAKPGMECVQTEIFGPVLSIIRCSNLSEAMSIEAKTEFGNATSVFTTSGAIARMVSEQASAGMVGINIGVPVPREPFSFGGRKQSRFGHGDITGRGGLEFWTDLKKITTKWSQQSDHTWMS